jgi:glycosyltransferase involved in cell wall biosynthesis
LRVAHVVATVGRSGVESHLLALLPAFDRTQVEARLFVPRPGPLVDALASYRFWTEPGAPTSKFAWREARALAAQLRGKCDVLHAHGPRAAFWCAIVARLAGIPRFVCTVHELRWRSLPPGPRRALWVAFEAWALRRADRLIVLSRDSDHRVRERFPELAPRLSIVPGSSPLLLDPDALPRASADESSDRMRVIAIGRFEWVKRHDLLLEAVALAHQRGARLELHLAGSGPLAPQLLERSRERGIEALVHWKGGRFDAPTLLASGHVYATASASETFGIGALEAMAVGLPVVTCDNGGVSELVEEGGCGVVVPAHGDKAVAKGLADAFVALAIDPARRAALGGAAARSARERFSPAVMARATAAAYRA